MARKIFFSKNYAKNETECNSRTLCFLKKASFEVKALGVQLSLNVFL